MNLIPNDPSLHRRLKEVADLYEVATEGFPFETVPHAIANPLNPGTWLPAVEIFEFRYSSHNGRRLTHHWLETAWDGQALQVCIDPQEAMGQAHLLRGLVVERLLEIQKEGDDDPQLSH